MKTYILLCKYCRGGFDVRCTPEDLRWYLRCCPDCVADDAPGMARFNRMSEMMGANWAIDHDGPV